jgi:hypothetical protein
MIRPSEVTNVTITKLSNWCLRAALVVAGLAFAMPAQAGWQSPFELTCFRKKQPQAVYYVAPVAPTGCCNTAPVVAQYVPPPQNVCTQYVPKTYYQQVTNYQPQTVVEPRTEYRTSYYYEPVTSYRYSYAYDPCNCSYQTVAVPEQRQVLRTQTVPVTTYVQKTQMVPVTQYRQMTYYEAQTTVTPAPAPVVGPWTTTPPAGSTVMPAQGFTPAGVNETRNPAGAVQESRTPATNSGDSPLYRSYGQPPANGTGRVAPAQTQPAVAPRADRITSNTGAWKPVTATLAKHAIPE